MLYFIYGQDSYSINQALSKMKANFLGQNSEINLIELSGAELSYAQFENAVFGLPFLGDKKLIVVKDFLLGGDKNLKQKVVAGIAKLPSFTVLIFVETGKPDAREAIFKYLEKNASKKEYELPSEMKLREFAVAKFKEENLKISPALISKLTRDIGPDLWRLDSEIGKIVALARAKALTEISKEEIEALVMPAIEIQVFDLIDAIAYKDTAKALSLLHRFSSAGEDLMRIFNLIIYQFRNMLVISDLLERGERQNLAKIAGLHPFVVKKIEQALKKIPFSKLENFYSRLEKIDASVKQGMVEIGTELDLLLVDFGK